jgi:outer membrane protein assembly factor BamD
LKTKIFFSVLITLTLIFWAACGGPRIKPTASASEQFAHAKKDYDKKHWLDAVEGFQRVIFNYPGANIVDTSQYYLAMSYFQNKEYELAAVEFRRLVTNYPMSDYTELSRFMAGLCYFENTPGNYALDQEDLKIAIEVLRDFILENPDSEYAADAKDIINQGLDKLAHKEYENGVLYYKIYDFRAARIYFQYVIDNFTETNYSALALYNMSEMDYKENKYTEAIDRFNNFITIYPSHELREKAQEYIDKISRHLESVDASSES